MANDSVLTAPPDWVVKPFFERGTLNSVYGIGKGGKSTLMAHIAVHVGLGRPFAGEPVARGPVLWIDLEQGPRRLMRNFEKIDGFREADILVDSNLRDRASIASVHALIKEHEPALVVIDSLSKFCHQVDDDNSNAQWSRALAPIEAIARESKTAIVVIDHDRKGEGSSGRAMRGASAKLAAFDTAIHVTRGDGAVRKLEGVSREIGDFSLSLELTPEGYRVAGGTVDRVLRALIEADSPIAVPQLHASLTRSNYPISQRSVRTHLEGLVASGKVTASGSGRKNDAKQYEALKNE